VAAQHLPAVFSDRKVGILRHGDEYVLVSPQVV
jgi:hypothetical protein